ncbi:histone H1 [Anolis carolinensis]|uniref:histone H1 n=1 Tax=Anolis carolinensis TaxID=28377 RepID=UPI002F2B5EEE
MAEVAPVAAESSAAPAPKAPAKKVGGAAKAKKSSGPSVTELLTQAGSASKECGGISLAALKKSLAAAGYNVEKNNSRIKLGLKSLVTNGTLVQTKSTSTSGSFKLNKKQASEGKEKKGAPPPPPRRSPLWQFPEPKSQLELNDRPSLLDSKCAYLYIYKCIFMNV